MQMITPRLGWVMGHGMYGNGQGEVGSTSLLPPASHGPLSPLTRRTAFGRLRCPSARDTRTQ
jgi:hypothetical protein